MKTIRNDCLDFDELSLEFLIRNGTSIRNFYLENWLHTFESCHEPLIQDFIRLARKYPDEKFLLSFNAHPTKLEQLPKNLTIKYM